MPILLALDIGTSSTRAIAYEAETCHPISDAHATRKHEPKTSADGAATLDADELVQEAVECAAEVLQHLNGQPVAGVGMSCFWHSLVGMDTDGNAQTPVLLWSDRRAHDQVVELKEVLDAAEYTERTGCPLHTSYLPGRLLWLAETDPVAFAASVRFVSPAEYIFVQLFGPEKTTCSVSMASGTGLWNQAEGAWDAETLARLPGVTPAKLSPVENTPVAGLREPYQSLLPALAHVPWFPALGDGACSNIGCGATTEKTVALMIGTSGALRVAVQVDKPPAVPPGLWRYQIDSNRYLLGGALSNGGSVWAWLKETLLLPYENDDTLENALAALPPNGHGLTVLPFLSGERAPLWRDNLRETIHGISIATTTTEIIRAHLEAVAYRFAAIRARLRGIAPQASLVGTGAGLLASPVWAQIIADALGEPIHLSNEEQASARGAMLWVREQSGLGKIADAPALSLTLTIVPNPENTAIYAKARDVQEDLLRRLP